MYESYWQLKQKPFESTSDPRFYYPGESHQAALLKVRYAIENRRGAALLAGPNGSGKTLVVNVLRQVLGDSLGPFVHLVFPQMPSDELLGYLADELDGSPEAGGTPSTAHSVRRIEQFLTENTRQGRHAILAVDEAQLLPGARIYQTLRLLLNFQTDGRPGLTLLLVGQPALLPILQRTPELEQCLAVKSLLRPFSERETAEYVAHRLKAAGALRTIFEPDALPALYELSHGIARQINRLCDLALLIGFAEQRQTITAGHIESVCQELVAVAPE